MNLESNNYCPCCGYNTFDGKERLVYEICPICFWEDDPVQFQEPDYEGGANRVSLTQAQKNFEKFGACEKDMVVNTRRLTSKDVKNPAWQ